MKKRNLVSIIVVAHNNRYFVETCLDSIRRATIYPHYEVLAIDNASTDDTREELQKYATSDQRIRLIPLTDNQNFAAANNVGVLHSRGNYFLFLNADTVVTSGWLQRLLGHVQKDKSIGAVVPVTNWAGNEARIEVTYRDLFEMEHFAGLLAERKRGETLEIDVAPLFCTLIPREVWNKVGDLDMQFEVGMFEDDDYALRIRQLGLRIVCAEDCFVHHFGRASFEKIESARYEQIFERNRARFEAKWGRSWKPHSYREGVTSEPRKFNPEEFLLRPYSRKLAEKNRRIAELSQELEESWKRSDQELEENRQILTRELAETQLGLRRAEDLLQRAAAGLRRFQDEFRFTLRTYKTQRAWTAMLMVRKAYGLVAGKGVQGILRFARWLTKLPQTAGLGLEEYELKFPSLPEYLPVELQSAMERNKGRTSQADGGHNKYDLIVLPVFDFGFRFQRPQQLARQFARNGHRVFWVSPNRAVPDGDYRPYRLVDLGGNLWEVQLRTKIPNMYLETLPPKRRREICDSLSQLYFDLAISESCALLQLPFWRSVAVDLRDRFGAKLVYDCMDDWESMPNVSDFIHGEEVRLVQECDVQLVSGRCLEDKHAAHGKKPVLIRNAADFELFSQAERNGRLDDIPKPIVGYFGSIAEWFDYKLLYEVAKSRPHYSFVLIGAYGLEDNVESEETALLRTLPNVYFLGHKDYSELPGYLADFDVCMIPFVVNDLTSATDPVKLYEYFSQGKPVVSTPLDEIMHWSDLVYIGEGPNEFAARLDRALTEDNEDLQERRGAAAAENTWSHRYSAIDTSLRASFSLVSILIEPGEKPQDVGNCINVIHRNTSYPSYELLILGGEPGSPAAEPGSASGGRNGRTKVLDAAPAGNWTDISRKALEHSEAEFWVLLNAQTKVTRGWIGRLLLHCRGDGRSIGAVVPVSNWPTCKTRLALNDWDNLETNAVATALARQKMLQHSFIECSGSKIPDPGCVLMSRDVLAKISEQQRGNENPDSGCDTVLKRVRELGLRTVCAEDCFVYDGRLAG